MTVTTSNSWILYAFMLATLLAGCGNPHDSKIVGVWEIESADSIASRLKENASESSNNNESRMSVEFASSGVLTTKTKMGAVDRQKEGSWKLLSFDEATSILNLECMLGLQTTQLEIKLLDENTIEMVPPNMAGVEMKLRFKRTKN